MLDEDSLSHYQSRDAHEVKKFSSFCGGIDPDGWCQRLSNLQKIAAPIRDLKSQHRIDSDVIVPSTDQVIDAQRKLGENLCCSRFTHLSTVHVGPQASYPIDEKHIASCGQVKRAMIAG